MTPWGLLQENRGQRNPGRLHGSGHDTCPAPVITHPPLGRPRRERTRDHRCGQSFGLAKTRWAMPWPLKTSYTGINC
eukprot:3683929-Pyramimonas_sp.AAC.4